MDGHWLLVASCCFKDWGLIKNQLLMAIMCIVVTGCCLDFLRLMLKRVSNQKLVTSNRNQYPVQQKSYLIFMKKR